MSVDYGLFSRQRLQPDSLSATSYDVLLSAYNDSERVGFVFENISAPRKLWLVHAEYGYMDSELPTENLVTTGNLESPVEAWNRFFRDSDIAPNQRLVVDITGMMRPHLATLPLMLRRHGFRTATFVYADPIAYVSGGDTEFTRSPVEEVRSIPGMSGVQAYDLDRSDILVVGAGYDHELVRRVVTEKRNALHRLMVGLPSLQPHMYQESVLRMKKIRESLTGYGKDTVVFSPAHDPFATAQELSNLIGRRLQSDPHSGIYLAPVGPKTQVLGFAWYFLCEGFKHGASLIFPYASRYSRETSRGIESVHSFCMDLDFVRHAISDDVGVLRD